MYRLLIIEDEEDIRDIITELFEDDGNETFAAANGLEGVKIAEEIFPDLILCDIMMPEADGYEVCTMLKEDPTTSAIPFIFISASVEKKAIDEGISLGAVEYIQKPFDPDELFEAITRCLQ